MSKQRNFTPRISHGELPDIFTLIDLTREAFIRAAEYWNARMDEDYEDILFAEVVEGNADTTFEEEIRGDWRFLQNSQRYRADGESINDPLWLEIRDAFTDTMYYDVEVVTQEMIEGEVTVNSWTERLAGLLLHVHLGAFMFGGGGINNVNRTGILSQRDILQSELNYLESFAQQIIDRNINNVGIQITDSRAMNRARQYVEKSTVSAEQARAGTYGFHPNRLPHYPADGSMNCQSRCRCHWQIVTRQEGGANAFWRLWARDGKNCTTCLFYNRIYNPYIVEGELIL